MIRAGRIDERVALEVCDEDQLRRLYLKFHADPQAAAQFAREHVTQRLAAAQVQGLLMRRFGALQGVPESTAAAPPQPGEGCDTASQSFSLHQP